MAPPTMPSTNSPCFPVPVSSDNYDESDTSILTSITSPLSSVQRIPGKVHKSSVNGNLSVASILSNAFVLPGFPRSSYAIIQSGQLGLTFGQIDSISKRLALVISALVQIPGGDHQANTNSDGDSVIMIVLNEEDYVDEQLVVLIITILRLGATYTIIHRNDLISDPKYWNQVLTLIEPLLVVALGDPMDMPTQIRQDLHLVSREHFDDFQDHDDSFNDPNDVNSNSSSLTDASSPLAASSVLIKKLQTSMILKPSLSKPTAISSKILWDLAVELRIGNEREKDLHVIHFRSETPMGQRTAFIFPCWPPFQSGNAQYWCRLSHKALRNRISWERMEFPMKPSEKICLTFPLQDPRSLMQIFSSFIHGKVLVLGETGEYHNGGFFLRKFRTESFRNVLRIELTPERLEELLETAKQTGMEANLAKIKMWIVSCNTGLPPSLAKNFFQMMTGYTDVTLVVTYGKAECLWCATWKQFKSVSDILRNTVQDKEGVSRVMMGVPLINSIVYIVDERKNSFCSVGQKGQIWIGGSMVPCNGYCGGPVLGRNSPYIFQTGDVGKMIQDKTGNLQLLVEGESEYPVSIKGKLYDMDEISKQIKLDVRLVRDACAFVCSRCRDTPEIVVAVVCRDSAKFDSVQEMALQVEPNIAKCFPVLHMPKYEDGSPDLKQLRALYFQYLGKCTSRQWSMLIPPKGSSTSTGATPDEDIEKNIQTMCKAIAFSLGVSLTSVVEGYEKSFWDIGGSAMRAIMTIKSCMCQGKRLCLEDFVAANLVSELGFRLILAEKEEGAWYQEVSLIRQTFIYSRMTKSDHRNIFEILLGNLKKLPGADSRDMEKYAHGLLETFDNSLAVVALTAEKREIIGVALNFRNGIKFHYVPAKLEEGVELFTSVLNSCKHLTHGIDNKNLAKSYILSVKTASHQILNPPQTMILLRDMIKESTRNAESVGCKGYLVCTMDPIVQEICCSLLGFEMLTEVQLNMYRNKKLQKPFLHFDDHHVMGVYFMKFQCAQ